MISSAAGAIDFSPKTILFVVQGTDPTLKIIFSFVGSVPPPPKKIISVTEVIFPFHKKTFSSLKIFFSGTGRIKRLIKKIPPPEKKDFLS